MTAVNFQTSDFSRKVANAADLVLKNRFFEQDPSLNDGGATLLARPGMRKLCTLSGTAGPIRGMISEPGSFGGDLFAVSGNNIVRLDNQLTQTIITSILENAETGIVNMAITGAIGTTPEYLFVADGVNLYVYVANGYAIATLGGLAANGQVFNVGGTYYQLTTGAVGTADLTSSTAPAGTLAYPWLVSMGSLPIDPFTNLANAVNSSGADGVDYTADITANPEVKATNWNVSGVTFRATPVGAVGNDLPSTVVTGTGVAFTTPTFTGGGSPSFTVVQIPDDIGAIDVAVINSFVIVIPVQDTIPGQFYWINPGETTIDPLNFATAERSPDPLYGVQVFGDQFWLPGVDTTEVWYVTGNPDAPMERLQGVVYDRGSWDNTARAIHEQMVVVDAYGGVFVVQGGAPNRVSTPSIEEQIRKAMQFQRFLGQ